MSEMQRKKATCRRKVAGADVAALPRLPLTPQHDVSIITHIPAQQPNLRRGVRTVYSQIRSVHISKTVEAWPKPHCGEIAISRLAMPLALDNWSWRKATVVPLSISARHLRRLRVQCRSPSSFSCARDVLIRRLQKATIGRYRHGRLFPPVHIHAIDAIPPVRLANLGDSPIQREYPGPSISFGRSESAKSAAA